MPANSLSSEQLKELIALGEKATARPWGTLGDVDTYTLWAPLGVQGFAAVLGCHHHACWDQEANASFIAASANAASDLAAEVIELRAEVGRLQTQANFERLFDEIRYKRLSKEDIT